MRVLQPLRRRLERRFAAWVRRRQGNDALPLRILARRLYILPTRAGVGFALLLFVMLLAGINYSNSLALFLTFLLAGLALVAMHQCHRNLLEIEIAAADATPAFAGERALLELVLANPRALDRLALQAAVAGEASDAVDLRAQGAARARLGVPVERRGRVRIDRIRLSTVFPFGLFEAWTWLHLPLEIVVYPAARGERLPEDAPGARSGARALHGPGDDEWSGLRAFREGDSPRQIAWKAYARGAPLLVKEYTSAALAERTFDFDALPHLGVEARLEQLCRWIVDADARGERYALRLPDKRIAAAQGVAQRDRCLTALALFGDAAPVTVAAP